MKRIFENVRLFLCAVSLFCFLHPSAMAQATGPRQVTFSLETNLSPGSTAYDQETTVAVNPSDPRNVVAGFFPRLVPNTPDCNFAVTFNAGRSWRSGGTVPRRPQQID